MKPIVIVGMGLAGACTAWHLWRRDVPFLIVDCGRPGSSQVAAGLIHAVTGKQCSVAEDFDIRRNEAAHFYQSCENILSQTFWHELEVVRLLDPREFEKMKKKFTQGAAASWVKEITVDMQWPDAVSVILGGGARLDVAKFLASTREFFSEQGCFEEREIFQPDADTITIFCEGARGLMRGNPVSWTHRCARGEILTVHAPHWKQERLVTGRGWLVPVGGDHYKVGSTYEWNDLEREPDKNGLRILMEMARLLGGDEFEILAHEAGIRPILRKSQPVAGAISDGVYVLNGLGSKGSLYAPWAAEKLVNLVVDGEPLDSSLSVDAYFAMLPHRA
jgi:glycine/D-amino acid oxidase-like deaminating enzyme